MKFWERETYTIEHRVSRLSIAEGKITIRIEHVPELVDRPFIITWGPSKPAPVPEVKLSSMQEAELWAMRELHEVLTKAAGELDIKRAAAIWSQSE